MRMKTILVTTDLSDFSKKAFPLARDLAQKYEAKIIVCYVEEHRVPPLVIEYPGVGFEDMMAHQRERATEHLEQLVDIDLRRRERDAVVGHLLGLGDNLGRMKEGY